MAPKAVSYAADIMNWMTDRIPVSNTINNVQANPNLTTDQKIAITTALYRSNNNKRTGLTSQDALVSGFSGLPNVGLSTARQLASTISQAVEQPHNQGIFQLGARALGKLLG